jgi:hypothetical protein
MSKFLKTATCLLVSSKPSARSGLRKMLCDLGANNQLVEVASDFNQASARLKADPVNLVFMEDDFESQSSIFDLIKVHKNHRQSSPDHLFVLMAGQINPSYQAEFTSNGGDLIIPKPYTIGSFTSHFNELLERRDQKIKKEKAVAVLKQKQRDKAMKVFGPIKSIQSDTFVVRDSLDQEFLNAYTSFYEKLDQAFDANSMVNVVSTGIKSKNYSELNNFVEAWIKSFPLYPESVPDITRVLVYNQNFKLLNQMMIDDKSAKMAMGAGMVIASSYYLDRGDKALSIEYAKMGIEHSGFKKNILQKAFEILMEAGAVAEAAKIFENPKLQASLAEDPGLLSLLKSMLGIKS